jgi:hypothetical protein
LKQAAGVVVTFRAKSGKEGIVFFLLLVTKKNEEEEEDV